MKEKGYLYVYIVAKMVDEYTVESSLIKFGITQNPIFRMADYYNKYPLGGIYSIQYCNDYKLCEREIKKYFKNAEYIPYKKESIEKINDIIEKYCLSKLDTYTIKHFATNSFYKNKVKEYARK